MKKSLSIALLLVSPAFAIADSPESSSTSTSTSTSSTIAGTPTPTPTPTACQSAATCVYENVPETVASCFDSYPTCGETNERQYAVTAEQVADAAIEIRKCNSRSLKTRGACNACYQAAKAPLKDRYYGRLFKGLLARAVSVIESKRKERCLTLRK